MISFRSRRLVPKAPEMHVFLNGAETCATRLADNRQPSCMLFSNGGREKISFGLCDATGRPRRARDGRPIPRCESVGAVSASALPPVGASDGPGTGADFFWRGVS